MLSLMVAGTVTFLYLWITLHKKKGGVAMLVKKEQGKYAWRLLVLVLVIGLLAGVVGGVLAGYLFVKPGPQGMPGLNGSNSILQMIQNRNDTQVDTSGYTAMQWYDLSDIDSSMEITINVQQNSKILAHFSGTNELEPPASIWVRIVVDHNYNSSTCKCTVGPPASGTYRMPTQVEFLTDSLTAGSHTINLQFLREFGSPKLLDRTLTVIEITSQ